MSDNMRPVAVIAVNCDDMRSHITVVACLNPVECYAHKYSGQGCDHIGRVVAGEFVPAKDAPSVSKHEAKMIVRASFALRNSLANVYETMTVTAAQITLTALEK